MQKCFLEIALLVAKIREKTFVALTRLLLILIKYGVGYSTKSKTDGIDV